MILTKSNFSIAWHRAGESIEWIHELNAALGDRRDGKMMGLSKKKKKDDGVGLLPDADLQNMKYRQVYKYRAIIIWEECD